MTKNLLISGLLLLVLGLGNVFVGQFKGEEYAEVTRELALLDKSPLEAALMTSPLLQFSKIGSYSERLLERRQKAEMRRNLYAVVEYGGKVIISSGLLCLYFSYISWLYRCLFREKPSGPEDAGQSAVP